MSWHGLYSLIHFLLCIFQEAFVVAVVLFFQPCAHIAACLTPMSWHALSCFQRLSGEMHKLCHAMSCLARCHALSCFQRLPGDKHKSCHVLPSPVTSTCRVMPCHVSSDCPPTKHKSCHGMASAASSIFFYASFKKHLSWPLHFMFFHALALFLNAPRQGHVDFDVGSCLGVFSQLSSRTSSEVLRKGNEIGREGEGRIGATQG